MQIVTDGVRTWEGHSGYTLNPLFSLPNLGSQAAASLIELTFGTSLRVSSIERDS